MRSPEAQALQDAIARGVSAYADYLERSDLVFNETGQRDRLARRSAEVASRAVGV